jgi:hypothetical protein
VGICWIYLPYLEHNAIGYDGNDGDSGGDGDGGVIENI